MKVYSTLYLFFALGERIFRDTVMVESTGYGSYKIVDKDTTCSYHFFKFDPPTDLTLDTIPIEPYKQVRYYPMFSKNESYDNYIKRLNKTKKEEIEIYKCNIEMLNEQLNKEYLCQEVERRNLIE